MNNIKVKKYKVKPYFYSTTASKINRSCISSTESQTSNKSELIKHQCGKCKDDFTGKNYEIDDELPF